MLEKLGRQEEAVTSFYEALLIDPSDRQVHKHLADHFLSRNQAVFALIHMTRNEELDPAPRDQGKNILPALQEKWGRQRFDPLVSPLSLKENKAVFDLFKTSLHA